MNVLLVNPAYPQTFWSFNRVLKMLDKKVLLPPLGLITLAAFLPRDWDLRLIELTVREISEKEWADCDILMVSGMVNQRNGILGTVAEGKRRGKLVVAGGPMPFHFHQDVFEAGADIVVKGEVELIVPQLLEALEGRKSGILIEAQERPDLHHSLPPRYDLLNMSHYVDMPLQFSRGCPFQCEFCDITLMFGRQVRTKSPDQILEELQILYDLGWRRAVFFVDDNFIGNPSRAKKLLRRLIPWMKERGYPFDFYTQASVNMAADDELMELMALAGFGRVFLGIETTDLESLELTKKYQNKAMDLDVVCSKINRAGFQIIAGCILGFDNECPGADQRLIDFAIRNQIPEMFVTLLQAGPGTDLWARLEREGRLIPTAFDDNFGSQTGTVNFVATRPIEEILNEFIRLYDVLYEPSFYLERTYRHFCAMKSVPYTKAFSLPYLSEVRAVLITLFRQGVLYPSRWKFWRLFFSLMRQCPRQTPLLSLLLCNRRALLRVSRDGQAARERPICPKSMPPTPDKVRNVRDKADAMRLYTRQQKQSFERQKMCAQIKLRAERKIGGMLKETIQVGGDPEW